MSDRLTHNRYVFAFCSNISVVVLAIQEIIEAAQVQMREYKKEIEMLRQEIGLMENNLSTQNDENVKVLNPYIMSNFEDLTNQITA